MSGHRRVKNEKVSAVPVSDRPITKREELPDNLRHLADKLPPYLLRKPAKELRGCAESQLYILAGEGRIKAVKSGGSTLWDTLSILIDLANLPSASISPPPSRKPKHPGFRGHPRMAATAPALITTTPAELAINDSAAV
jgi:hypothetical protein